MMFRPSQLLLGAALVAACAQAPALEPGWEKGAFMEIFVRGYQDSNGDGVGDLRGIVSRLDYLKDLGVRGLWLMPVTASGDHDHGYATSDYRRIAPEYGTNADMAVLLREAHKRGIGVIMDYVVNHSSESHPYFRSAKASRKSPYRDWYVFADAQVAGYTNGWQVFDKNPWYDSPTGQYLGIFGKDMPDFNWRNPKVVKYHFDSLRYWLQMGLDGYRLDAVPHLIENNAKDWNDQPESRKLTKQMQTLIRSYPGPHQHYVVCEATADPLAYAKPEVCGSAFAFGLQYEIIKSIKGDAKALEKVAEYYASMPAGMATMLTNHDGFAGRRVADQFEGDERRMRLAAATYLLGPGTPFIYYGEELGMAGAAGLKDDEELRGPMSWGASRPFTTAAKPYRPLSTNAAQRNAEVEAGDPASMLAFYKSLLALRNGLPAIAQGSFEQPRVNGSVLSFQRRLKDQPVVVVALNMADKPARVQLEQLPREAAFVAELPQGAPPARSDAEGRITVDIPPLSVVVYRSLP
ncbi:alpha-amylase family glycosyl hydrolase [Burkholderiaceae bacterium UC74_6]